LRPIKVAVTTPFSSIADREACSERYVRSVLPLAFLAPDVIRAAIDGRLPEGWGVSQVLRDLPALWGQQTLRTSA
jgi:site-specific DNA recombinase